MKKTVLYFLAFLAVSCSSKANETNAPNTTRPINTTVYQAVLDAMYQEFPESIGIMAHVESPSAGISWSGSVGYSDDKNKNPLHPKDPALIASCIKTYVSASILKLQEEGKLTIEDPIAKHLTAKTVALFRKDAYAMDSIKIKHLLSHTSGIGDYVNTDYFLKIDNNPTYRWTRDEQLQLATEVTDPLGAPQELFKYADVNYLLATEIIEQKTKQPFYTAMRDLLEYEALGFENTWFPTLEEKPINTKPLVHQYWNEEDWGEAKMDISWDSAEHDISWDLYGGGGIATTMEELAKFSYHLFHGDIIKNKAVLSLLSKDVPTSDGIPKIYRLGVSDASIKGLQSLGHGGFWGTQVFYLPELDASISLGVLERKGKMKVIKKTLNTLVETITNQKYPTTHHSDKKYELYTVKDAEATLVLFPGGGAIGKDTKESFDIGTTAQANKVNVLFMNFNNHLWIDEATTSTLADDLNSIFLKRQLTMDKVSIGGMSIGGNVALSLSNYLQQQASPLAPKSTFIVDAPIDLYALYKSSLKDISNPDFEEERLAEPKWIVATFEKECSKDSLLSNLQKVSPFTFANKQHSVGNLKKQKLRFYTEPDSLWWKENRQTDFESTNAFAIQQIAKDLKAKEWKHFELIETENKGFRTNGDRHPHSWSIVDSRKLIEWIKDE